MNHIADLPAHAQPIHNGSSQTKEIGNFKDYTLYSLCVNTVCDTLNIEKLPITQELFKRSIKGNNFNEIQKLAQKSYNTRNYETMKELTKSGYQFNKDKLNTLMQENITNINTCITELDASITKISQCLKLGANITQKQLDECLQQAIMKHDIVAIDRLLSLGATHPGQQVLNNELQWFINDDDNFKEYITEIIKSTDGESKNHDTLVSHFEKLLSKTTLSRETENLLESKLQDAIAKGDYTTVVKLGYYNRNLPLNQRNQAFEATFKNGCTSREQLYCLVQWIDMGAMASDEQKSLIAQQIIDQGIIKEYTINTDICFSEKCLNFYIRYVNISQESYTLDLLSELLNLHKITNPSARLIYKNVIIINKIFNKIITEVNKGLKIPDTQLTEYISKATDSGYALFTKFLFETHPSDIELTKDQLNYGLLQNLKIAQTKEDIELWLDMGADTELFEKYFLESLNSGYPIKIWQLSKISMEVEKFNHITTNKEYLFAIQKICEQKAENKKIRYVEFSYHSEEDVTPIMRIWTVPESTEPSFAICCLLEEKLINVDDEISTLCLNQAIENQDMYSINVLTGVHMLVLNENQQKQLKEQLINNGINSVEQSRFIKVVNMLNFNLDELCLAYSRAISKSQSTLGYWKTLIDEKVELSLDTAIENLDFISINELIAIKKLPLNEEQKDKLKKQVIAQGIPLNEVQKEELKKHKDIPLMILKTGILNMVSFTKEELDSVYSSISENNKAS